MVPFAEKGLKAFFCESRIIWIVKMDRCSNISDWLKTLIDEYHFNLETLSRYLELSAEQIIKMKEGTTDFLPRETSSEQEKLLKQYSRIGFLYCCAADHKDVKLSAFLEALISYHRISKETIAKMSGVDIKDIEKILCSDKNRVSSDVKFKLAVTVFSLRFFLKDCEDQSMPDNLPIR